jgi:hypothetical protein
MWQKEEDTIIRHQKYIQGYPQTVKQKMEHLPGTTAKQIRDKHRDPSFKALLEHYNSAQGYVVLLHIK